MDLNTAQDVRDLLWAAVEASSETGATTHLSLAADNVLRIEVDDADDERVFKTFLVTINEA